MFTIVKELHQEGVITRIRDMQRHRAEYIVPGSNYIRSLDGYCKLDLHGLKIATIDVYSRYVVWMYVGISARTSICILRQYLDTIQDRQVMPFIIRFVRGVETPLCANTHFELFKQSSHQDLSFDKCYF